MPSSSSTTNTTTTSTSTADQEISNNNEDNETSSFDLYRNDFKIHIQQIELKFHDDNNNTENNDDDKNISYKSSTSSSPSLVSIQELLKNCDELIQQMELEIIQRGRGGERGGTTTKDDDSAILFVKQNQKDILQACKLQLLSYKTLEKTTHHRQPKNKNNTKSSTDKTDENDDDDDEDKTLLLWDETIERNYLQQAMVIQDSVGRQNNRLSEALQSIRETEQVANSISVELTKNRQKISSAHNKTKSISSMTQNADKLIKSMSKPWWKFWG